MVLPTITGNGHFLPGKVEVAWIGGEIQGGNPYRFGCFVHDLFRLFLFNDAVHVGSHIPFKDVLKFRGRNFSAKF